MQSLSAHLRNPDDHGRLPFHPDCSICRRERLVGVLPPEGIVSRRTQALLASSVLALSAAAPTAVLAAEPDQEQEGSAVPDQVTGGDPVGSPDFDPGGNSTDLPLDELSAPQGQLSPDPNSDDTGALDEEPAKDTGAPIVDAGDEAAGPTAQDQLSAPAQPAPSPPPPAEQPVSPSEPPPNVTAPGEPVAAPTPPPGEAVRTRTRKPRNSTSVESRKHEVTQPSLVQPSSGAAVEPAQAPPAASPPAGPSHAEPGDRSHVVHSGESLWSIASDLLGGETSAARIAREVHELWALNKERIGTGDPDLLMVGTTLRLR